MLTRRSLAAVSLGVVASPAWAQTGSFQAFVAGVKAEARSRGISPATVERAFAGVQPNAKVLELDGHQAEFTMTWAEYRQKIVGPQRLSDARDNAQRNRALLGQVSARYGVDAGVIIGIWGLESNFGSKTGGFGVIEALATLAWDGRRAAYFRGQLMDALRILDHRDIDPARMTGSWAGAMGQPQFMPNSYLAYAVDFAGKGRRDIWTDRADVFGSIANYLSRSGWRAGEPAAIPVRLANGFDSGATGRDRRRTLGEWSRAGVRLTDGSAFARTDAVGAVVQPDGAGGEAFMVFPNFTAIRRYNPSDFYALAVTIIGDAVPA